MKAAASPHEGLVSKGRRRRPMPAPCVAAVVYFPSGYGGGGTMQVSLVLHGEIRDELAMCQDLCVSAAL